MNLNDWSKEDKITNFNDYVQQYVNENHPQMITQSFTPNVQNMSNVISTFEVKNITVSKNDLNDFQNVVTTNNFDDMTTQQLLSDNFYCPTYYAHSDTFVIPTPIYDMIQQKSVKTNVAVYNVDKTIKQHTLFKDFKVVDKPNLIVDNIPQQSSYSVFSNTTQQALVLQDLEYMPPLVFKNLPLNMLMNTKVLAYDCAYCVNDNQFYFNYHPKKEFDEYVVNIAKNGFASPLMLKLTNDYSLAPNNLKYELIAAMYLGIPEIPVCIFQSFNDNDAYEYVNNGDGKTVMTKFLEPQMILS